LRKVIKYYEFVPQSSSFKDSFKGTLTGTNYLKRTLIRVGYTLREGQTKDGLDIDTLLYSDLGIIVDLWYMNGTVEVYIDFEDRKEIKK
jgi:hypothetical protein